MVKKKRQSDPGDHVDDSTESCDENVKTSCPHITKAVELARLKKVLKDSGFKKDCSECGKSGALANNEPDYETDVTLWMCLRCGSQLCGRAKNKHALNHFSTPHSDCHSITVNTTSWDVYCYKCNNEVNPSTTKKLLECVEYLKKQSNNNRFKSAENDDSAVSTVEVIKTIITEPKTNEQVMSLSLPRVRGLSNLGNTCFFNSVMQCLVQTPYLLPILQEMSEAGETFTLPGGKLMIEIKGEEPKEVSMPPINGELSEWGMLTRTLAETLEELQSAGKCDVYSPRKLLSALVSKLPQFGGGDQHDSHELLRHLLEGVRSEDLRRYHSVILDNLGLSRKVDPAKVEGVIKQKVKFYGQQASDTMLRPEQVFRGFLVSTLECQECRHTSDRHEYFLDLSLPVAVDRPQPPAVRRKASQDDNYIGQLSWAGEDTKPSHQLMKDRLKPRRRQKSGAGGGGHSSNKIDNTASPDGGQPVQKESKSSSEQSDADVEDNLDDNPKRTETKATESRALPETAANFAAYYMESGYNSEKVISSDSVRTSPVDSEHKEKVDEPERLDKDKSELREHLTIGPCSTAIPLGYKPSSSQDNHSNPDSGVASPDATKNNSSEAVDNVDSPMNSKDLGSPSSLSSEINLDLSSPQHSKTNTSKSEFDRPVSRISFAKEIGEDTPNNSISTDTNCLYKYGDKRSVENLSSTIKAADKLDKIRTSLDNLQLNEEAKTAANKKVIYSLPYSSINSVDTSSNYLNAPDTLKLTTDLDTTLRKDYSPFIYRSATVSPRYQCDEGECSIQSCLNQFTALELMTGNNKVGCEACTKRINGENGKTVYTNATKRFLVSSPPAVLILHLKRFQIGPRCMFRKMTKHVNFPTILDLAPFCSTKKFKTWPNVTPGQSKLLYSLYGVVEHSGGMHGGHYVAYVKVRHTVKKDDKRWGFIPTGGNVAKEDATQNDSNATSNGFVNDDSESSLSGYESGENMACGGVPEGVKSPPGKWYYISDSRVQEITEDKVLRAQAYLLFYERIL